MVLCQSFSSLTSMFLGQLQQLIYFREIQLTFQGGMLHIAKGKLLMKAMTALGISWQGGRLTEIQVLLHLLKRGLIFLRWVHLCATFCIKTLCINIILLMPLHKYTQTQNLMFLVSFLSLQVIFFSQCASYVKCDFKQSLAISRHSGTRRLLHCV